MHDKCWTCGKRFYVKDVDCPVKLYCSDCKKMIAMIEDKIPGAFKFLEKMAEMIAKGYAV